jgi:hypothetical protein
MKVVVEFTTESRAELFALLTARMPTEGDAARFAAEFLEDMGQQLRDYEGQPPEAEKHVVDDRETWWWRYVNGIWMGYRFEDRTAWMFRTVRQVTVFAFEPLPPSP